jgi:hypothetical protein
MPHTRAMLGRDPGPHLQKLCVARRPGLEPQHHCLWARRTPHPLSRGPPNSSCPPRLGLVAVAWAVSKRREIGTVPRKTWPQADFGGGSVGLCLTRCGLGWVRAWPLGAPSCIGHVSSNAHRSQIRGETVHLFKQDLGNVHFVGHLHILESRAILTQSNQTTTNRQSFAESSEVPPVSIIADATALIKGELGTKRVVSANSEALSDVSGFGPLSGWRDVDECLAILRKGTCLPSKESRVAGITSGWPGSGFKIASLGQFQNAFNPWYDTIGSGL